MSAPASVLSARPQPVSAPAARSLPVAIAPARLFLTLAVVTWGLIAFGALVRAKQAGLSCPDWPLCHGDVVPNLELKGVIFEFGHRVLAGLVTLTYVSGSLLLWRRRELWPRFRRWVLAGGALLLVQIIFGGLTVLVVHHGEGAPRPAAWPVATHLFLGNSFAAVALVLGLKLRRLARGFGAQPLVLKPLARRLALAWTASVVAQFILGGLVAGNIAGMVCTQFPACNGGQWFPAWTGFVGLQVFHRLNAYLLGLLGWSLMAATWRAGVIGRVTRLMGTLIALQIVLGAINIFSYLHAPVTTAHSLVAALLFSSTAALWFVILSARHQSAQGTLAIGG